MECGLNKGKRVTLTHDMDIVTHGITGVLVSRAVPSGHKTSVMAAGLIGALALFSPDMDG